MGDGRRETGDGRRETGDGRRNVGANPCVCPPSFPPYTVERLARRFPGDSVAHRRILALRAWLVDTVTPATSAAANGLSRATLYRLRATWEQHGIVGLLSPVRVQAPGVDAQLVRKLLKTLGRHTTFALGCLPEAQTLAPHHPDPATRGRLLAHVLREALQEIDADIERCYGVQRFTTCRFLQRACVRALGETAALSSSSVQRLLTNALEQVAEQLPQRLNQPAPPAVWTTCVDDEHIAAELAAWERAGWNIVWARHRVEVSDTPDALLTELHVQLAEIGALDTPQPDPCCCCAQQRAVVTAGFFAVPMVLAPDGIQPECAVIGRFHHTFDCTRIDTCAPVVVDTRSSIRLQTPVNVSSSRCFATLNKTM